MIIRRIGLARQEASRVHGAIAYSCAEKLAATRPGHDKPPSGGERALTTGVTRDRTVFLKSFLRDWRTIGSVTPSSQYSCVRCSIGSISGG